MQKHTIIYNRKHWIDIIICNAHKKTYENLSSNERVGRTTLCIFPIFFVFFPSPYALENLFSCRHCFSSTNTIFTLRLRTKKKTIYPVLTTTLEALSSNFRFEDLHHHRCCAKIFAGFLPIQYWHQQYNRAVKVTNAQRFNNLHISVKDFVYRHLSEMVSQDYKIKVTY